MTSTETTTIGNTSLKHFVQSSAASTAPTTKSATFVTSTTASSSSVVKPKLTTSDLRQFRKPQSTSANAMKPTTIPITSQTKLAAAQAAAVKKAATEQQQPTANGSSGSRPVVKPIPKPALPKQTAPTTAFALGATQQALIAAQCVAAAANNGARHLTAAEIDSLPQFAAAQAAALSQAAAAAVVEQQKAMMALRLPLNAGRSGLTTTSSPLSSPTSSFTNTQLPSKRLQLKVKTTSSSDEAPTTSPVSTTANFPSLYSHMAADTLWKYRAGLEMAAQQYAAAATTTAGSLNGTGVLTSNASKLGSIKTLNQTIRQIPNPSLLTKQSNANSQTTKSDDAQKKLLQQQSRILQQMAAATSNSK